MDHVIELAMDVADDDHGLLNADHVGFVAVDVSDFLQNAHETLLFHLSLDHQVLANEIHVWLHFPISVGLPQIGVVHGVAWGSWNGVASSVTARVS